MLRKPAFTNYFSFETIKTGLFVKNDFVECEMRRIKLLNRRTELVKQLEVDTSMSKNDRMQSER